jgi:hypothetical protein
MGSMNEGDFNPPADLEMTVERRGETAVITARLEQPAEFCYRLFCRVDDVPGWLWVVGRAVVQERDAQGRALEVDFMGSLKRASIAYSLSYTFDDDLLEVCWHRRSGSLRALAGAARFTPEADGGCRMRYVLHSELPEGLPRWEDELYQSRPAEAVMLDFCDWVDRKWEERRPTEG